MLYSRGVYINRCYDELNLTSADLVLGVQREYVKAGADIIETNTYGANRVKLDGLRSGRQDSRDQSPQARVWRAKQPATALSSQAPSARSAFALSLTARPPTEEARAIFREQAEALLEGGVDLFVLETFSDIAEIHQAHHRRALSLRSADRRADDDSKRRQHELRHFA